MTPSAEPPWDGLTTSGSPNRASSDSRTRLAHWVEAYGLECEFVESGEDYVFRDPRRLDRELRVFVRPAVAARVDEPLVLGHEAGGTIAAVGAGVRTHAVDQRVSIEPGVPCRSCAQCLAGRYNLCPSMRFFATPPYDGAFADSANFSQLTLTLDAGTYTVTGSLLQSVTVDGFALNSTAGGLSVTAVPEPTSLALVLAAAGVVGVVSRRRARG